MLTSIYAKSKDGENVKTFVVDLSKISYISSLQTEKQYDSSMCTFFDMIIDGIKETFVDNDEELMRRLYSDLAQKIIQYDPLTRDINFLYIESSSGNNQEKTIDLQSLSHVNR